MRVLTIKELMLLGILASTIHVTVPYRDGRFVREVREGKKPAFSDGLRMAGAPGFEPGNGGIKIRIHDLDRGHQRAERYFAHPLVHRQNLFFISG